MNDLYFWMAFFGAPLLLILITVYIYRPSARRKYREAKKIPFEEDERSGQSGM